MIPHMHLCLLPSAHLVCMAATAGCVRTAAGCEMMWWGSFLTDVRRARHHHRHSRVRLTRSVWSCPAALAPTGCLLEPTRLGRAALHALRGTALLAPPGSAHTRRVVPSGVGARRACRERRGLGLLSLLTAVDAGECAAPHSRGGLCHWCGARLLIRDAAMDRISRHRMSLSSSSGGRRRSLIGTESAFRCSRGSSRARGRWCLIFSARRAL